MTAFDAASLLIVLAAVLGFVNYRFLRLPQNIALTLMGAVAAIIVVGIDAAVPGSSIGKAFGELVLAADFRTMLLDGMLSFLLFAGALHVDWSGMRRARWAILALTTVGIAISTVIIGASFYGVTRWIGLDVSFAWCLAFGALISPTDPVAVLEVLQRAPVSDTLRASIAGESLFNDGVGIVIFGVLVGNALGGELSITNALQDFALEAGGGVALGLLVGWLAMHAMRSVDDYVLEVLITLAVVMGGYTLAHRVHASGPIAMAVAGLLTGNRSVQVAMSDRTRDYLVKFWELVDGVLNAVLFLLIGLELVSVPMNARVLAAGAAAVPLVLIARACSVAAPLVALQRIIPFGSRAIVAFTWGGIRGGISVALALGLPAGESRATLLAATYAVVLFTVLVQGGTLAKVLGRLMEKPA